MPAENCSDSPNGRFQLGLSNLSTSTQGVLCLLIEPGHITVHTVAFMHLEVYVGMRVCFVHSEV